MSSALLALGLLSPAAPALSGPTAPIGEVHVVVVGHNAAFNPEQKNLKYADDDAARFFELVAPGAKTATLLTEFDASSQRTFAGLAAQARVPTRRAVFDAIGRARRAVSKAHQAGVKASFYFYYAGHGDVDGSGEGIIGLQDGQLTRDDIYREIIDGMPADRVHLVVDACKSYFLVGGRGPGGRSEPHSRPFAGPRLPPGVGLVLSTSSDADSHEWAALPGGVFSHEVRSGLVGGADVNGDGAVDYEELAAFVAMANSAIPAERFKPDVLIRAPRAERRARIFNPGALPNAAQLVLEPSERGRLQVMDARGLLYADAHKARDTPFSMSLLAPAEYVVNWHGKTFKVDATSGHPAELIAQRSSEVFERGAGHEAFQSLFSEPFGVDVMRGYRLAAQAAPLPTEIAEPPSRLFPIVLASVGASAIGGGVWMFDTAADEQGAAARGNQVDRKSRNDLANNWRSGGTVAVGVGVVALATAVYLLLESP